MISLIKKLNKARLWSLLDFTIAGFLIGYGVTKIYGGRYPSILIISFTLGFILIGLGGYQIARTIIEKSDES